MICSLTSLYDWRIHARRTVTFKKKDGAKGMHVQKCSTEEKAPVQRTLTTFVEKQSLPQLACDNLPTELIKFIACDMRPLSSVDGWALCQTMVNIGARYSHFDVTKWSHVIS